MNEVSPVFPFGTSLFFVYFLGYAIWVLLWRTKKDYGRAWMLGSSAFLAGMFLAFSFALWQDNATVRTGWAVVALSWTCMNLVMTLRLYSERMRLREYKRTLMQVVLPSVYSLSLCTDAELTALVSRAYGVLLERDIHHDLQPSTSTYDDSTQRLVAPGE